MENQEVTIPPVIVNTYDGKTPCSYFGINSPTATIADFIESDSSFLNPDLKVGIEIEIEGIEGALSEMGAIEPENENDISEPPQQDDYDDYDDWQAAFTMWEEANNHQKASQPTSSFLKRWSYADFPANVGWEVIKDGSLRNGGREFVSKPAFRLSDSASWIECLYGCLPSTADFNPRCAIHMHVDFSNVEFSRVRKFISLYYLFEWAVFNLTNANRRNNVFCVALQDTHDYIGYLNFSSISEEYFKYSAFNICPLSKYGTIEFRHFESTGDIIQIKKWLKVIDLLYDFAIVKHGGTFAEFMFDIFKLNSNSQFEQFGNNVFKNLWAEVSVGQASSREMVDAIIGMKGAFATQSAFVAEDLEEVLKQPQYKEYFYFPKSFKMDF